MVLYDILNLVEFLDIKVVEWDGLMVSCLIITSILCVDGGMSCSCIGGLFR